MYELVKLFDKTILTAGEVIEKLYYKPDGTIYAVETNKSVYQLKVIGNG